MIANALEEGKDVINHFWYIEATVRATWGVNLCA